MFAITTRYHGPTNFRGSRISATIHDGADFKRRVFVDYDYSLSPTGDAHHRVAAEEMCLRLTAEGFTYTNPDLMISGTTKDGYVFVFTPDALRS